MYRIVIAYICSVILFVGCQSPLEKSVMEPLTSEQLDKVAKEDKSFLVTYSIVEEKWNYITSSADSARWSAINYGRLHNYLNTTKNAELNTPLFESLRRDWENSYTQSNMKADSIVSYWKNYLSVNSPDSLVSIIFSGVELEKFRNNKKEIYTIVKVKLKIKPLSFNIDSLSLIYSFILDSNNVSINPVNYKRKIMDSTIIKVYPNLLPDIKKSIVNSDTLLQFSASIQSVYLNGKCYNIDSIKKDMPKSVLAYIEAELSKDAPFFDSNYYIQNIIRKEIDPAFMSQSAYIKLNAENYYKRLDSLVFNFLNYRGL